MAAERGNARRGRLLRVAPALWLSATFAAVVMLRGAGTGRGLRVELANGGAPSDMSPAQRALAALKDTHLFWGPALQLDDDAGGEPAAWRDADHNLQEMANDALDLCDEVKDQEVSGEEAVEGQGKGQKRRCVHRVVSARDTRFTHTPAGLNDWTQPLQAKDLDGEAYGGEHNHAITLMKVVNQFKPRTEWHGETLYKDGVMVRIPTYDRSKYRGFRGASTEANLLFDASAGNRKFGDFTMDSDADSSGDESYDQITLDAEKMIWGKKPGFEAAHLSKATPDAKLVSKAAARNTDSGRTELVKHKRGKFTIWEHRRVPLRRSVSKRRGIYDPMMEEARGQGQRGTRVITNLYGPSAAQEPAEQVPTAAEKQRRLQQLWEVTDTINIGATPPIPASSVVTQTQSVVFPGAQYFTPGLGRNGFATVQPLPVQVQGPAVPGCGLPDLPPCSPGVSGSSAVTQMPYPVRAQWMQPPPIQYSQQQPQPPVYINKVSSSVTSTVQSPPASVTQVETVEQPWAAASNLPAETHIVEEETEIPEPLEPNKFHVSS